MQYQDVRFVKYLSRLYSQNFVNGLATNEPHLVQCSVSVAVKVSLHVGICV